MLSSKQDAYTQREQIAGITVFLVKTAGSISARVFFLVVYLKIDIWTALCGTQVRPCFSLLILVCPVDARV